LSFLLLLDAANGSRVFGPGADRFEVLDGMMGGVLTRSFLGCKEVLDGTELLFLALYGK
jgi:hypothetical protein